MNKDDRYIYICIHTHTHTHTHIHTYISVEYYSAIKKNEIIPSAAH